MLYFQRKNISKNGGCKENEHLIFPHSCFIFIFPSFPTVFFSFSPCLPFWCNIFLPFVLQLFPFLSSSFYLHFIKISLEISLHCVWWINLSLPLFKPLLSNYILENIYDLAQFKASGYIWHVDNGDTQSVLKLKLFQLKTLHLKFEMLHFEFRPFWKYTNGSISHSNDLHLS